MRFGILTLIAAAEVVVVTAAAIAVTIIVAAVVAVSNVTTGNIYAASVAFISFASTFFTVVAHVYLLFRANCGSDA